MKCDDRFGWDVDILGVRVSAINMQEALSRLDRLVVAPDSSYVCVTGVHGIIESQTDQTLLEIHNEAAMVTPDGMPTVWSGWVAGARWMERVYGPDLLLAACDYGVARGWRHFLYGGGDGVAERLAGSLKERVPTVDIVGTRTPPFRDFDDDFVREEVADLQRIEADIVWIGLSTPKQEILASKMSDHWQGPVFIGVGAAFDFHSGTKAQAPKAMQKMGLEWLFRLAQEPQRLGPRYARMIPSFLARSVVRPPRLLRRARP